MICLCYTKLVIYCYQTNPHAEHTEQSLSVFTVLFFSLSEYRSSMTTGSSASTQPVTAFFSSCDKNSDGKYGMAHSQQKAITKSIIEDLVVGCNLPLSLVENDNFRRFLAVIDHRYDPISRGTVSVSIDKLADSKKMTLIGILANVKSVSLTVDVWTDRRMRAFLGITAHYIALDAQQKKHRLFSALLSCDRFTGSHTGERIAAELDTVMDQYKIKQKIDCIISDNAANMRKALTITLTNNISVDMDGDDGDETDVDDPEIWEVLNDDGDLEVQNVIVANCRQERLSCFDHTLHLTVGDGLNEKKCAATALAKSCKISSMLHTSANFKDAFEKVFGKDKSINAAVSTRWNSTLRQIKSLLSLDFKLLSDLLENQDHKNLVLTAREWGQLIELVDVLDPFLEATVVTEGEKVATISKALPSVLSLHSHLKEMLQQQRLKYSTPVAKALLTSLKTRFSGMFKRLQGGATSHEGDMDVITNMPFGSDIYVISTFFDPQFRLEWIDKELDMEQDEKNSLRRAVTGVPYFLKL